MNQSDKSLLYILEATALSSNADTHFAAIAAGEQAILANINKDQALFALPRLLDQVDEQELYIAMMNAGNFLEIGAELRRQQETVGDGAPYDKWQAIATAVLDTRANQAFRLMRAQIFKPFTQVTAAEVEEIIDDSKAQLLEHIGVPNGVTPDQLSWDAISYKVVQSAAEMFCVKYPDAMLKLSPQELGIIDEAQLLCARTIDEKCAEYRARSETTEDEFIPDATLFLEGSISGGADSEREVRIRRMSKDTLRKYIDQMQSLFASGHLPGTIAPSKIFASHDMIGATQLRASIMKLAEMQTVQEDDILNNPNTRRRSTLLANGIPGDTATQWTVKQRQSILLSRNICQGYRMGLSSFGANYNKPMTETRNQLSGGANSLADQVDLNLNGSVLRMSHEENELLKQQLSVLLACLRIRCDAIQSSAWELVTEEDFEHMEMVRHMAQVSSITADDTIYRTATVLMTTYQSGHQNTKFEGKWLPEELNSLITYSVQGRVKSLLRAVPILQTDIEEGGPMFEGILKCIYMTCAAEQRNKMEEQDRFIRRTGTAQSAIRITQ